MHCIMFVGMPTTLDMAMTMPLDYHIDPRSQYEKHDLYINYASYATAPGRSARGAMAMVPRGVLSRGSLRRGDGLLHKASSL